MTFAGALFLQEGRLAGARQRDERCPRAVGPTRGKFAVLGAGGHHGYRRLIGKSRGSGRAVNAGAAAKKAAQVNNSKKRCAGDASSGKNKLAKKGGGRHGAGGGAGHRDAGGGSGCAHSMALGDTGGDDDALPPLEELSGADASPRNGAGARGYDFDREDRRRGVRGAGTMRRLCYIEPASHGGHGRFS